VHKQMRIDRQLADVVTNGIDVDNARGTAFAWAYMSARAVPTSVIFRVLSEVRRRRNTDPTSFWLDWESTRNSMLAALRGF
jgi:hypothetical protein